MLKNIKNTFFLFWVLLNCKKNQSFCTPHFKIDYDVLGKWSIKGSKSILNIQENEITITESASQLAMKPRFLTNRPVLKLHLHSLEIQKYPLKLDHRALLALSWIHKIKKHGIDVELLKLNSTIHVAWNVSDKCGECILEKII